MAGVEIGFFYSLVRPQMRHRFITAIFLAHAATAAQALDASDVGMYNVIHRDGRVVEMTFIASVIEERWRILRKQAGNKWEDVTCEGDCALRESSLADLSHFFSAEDLKQITPTCVHNKAFAFCRYEIRVGSPVRGYVFVALLGPRPIHVRLARVP